MEIRNSSHAASPASQFRVLLVSSGADGSSKLISLLHDMHCDVVSASTCRQVLPLLHSEEVPVLVTDPVLPDGDWKGITNEITRLRTPPSVIVVSDSSDWRLWADVLSAGGFDLLSKPWTPETVAWTLQSAFRRWQRAREVAEARDQNTLVTEPELTERS
jgi:DNA-binding NtrC family response regulator